MNHCTTTVNTSGEKFYNITGQIQTALSEIIINKKFNKSGILILYMPHTSCGLTISEAFEQSAADDMVKFLTYIAPRNLKFITHTTEGEDDSPSHMKAILLQQSLNLVVENGEIILGRWQGIYLAEFRDGNKQRNIIIKYVPDMI